jgi:hypothetical protein
VAGQVREQATTPATRAVQVCFKGAAAAIAQHPAGKEEKSRRQALDPRAASH